MSDKTHIHIFLFPFLSILVSLISHPACAQRENRKISREVFYKGVDYANCRYVSLALRQSLTLNVYTIFNRGCDCENVPELSFERMEHYLQLTYRGKNQSDLRRIVSFLRRVDNLKKKAGASIDIEKAIALLTDIHFLIDDRPNYLIASRGADETIISVRGTLSIFFEENKLEDSDYTNSISHPLHKDRVKEHPSFSKGQFLITFIITVSSVLLLVFWVLRRFTRKNREYWKRNMERKLFEDGFAKGSNAIQEFRNKLNKQTFEIKNIEGELVGYARQNDFILDKLTGMEASIKALESYHGRINSLERKQQEVLFVIDQEVDAETEFREYKDKYHVLLRSIKESIEMLEGIHEGNTSTVEKEHHSLQKPRFKPKKTVRNNPTTSNNEDMIFYTSAPVQGSFLEKYATDAYQEGRSIYEFTKKSNTITTFELVSQAAVMKKAVSKTDVVVEPVSAWRNTLKAHHTKIKTISPGKAELRGGKWVVTEKAVIEYV